MIGEKSPAAAAMPSDRRATKSVSAGNQVPEGYDAILFEEPNVSTPLRLAVLVKKENDTVAGGLVVLRQTLNARVVLGCVADAAANVWEWVEIWIQTASGLANSVQAAKQSLTNQILDQRWHETFLAFGSLGASGGVLVSGLEREHPTPLLIDRSQRKTVALRDSQTKSPWLLCVDDSVLTAVGLPPYGSSTHRYLYQPDKGKDSSFVPVTTDAPAGPRTRDLASILPGDSKQFPPLNVEAGKIFVRKYSPVNLSALLEVLSGRRWKGVAHGSGFVPLCGSIAALQECDRDESGGAVSGGHLFLGRHGRGGRVTEAYHLKLRLLADMVAQVRRFVEAARRPLLSLGEDSFEVRMAEPGTGLPFLWGAQVALCDPGDAVTLPVPGAEVQFFAKRQEGLSIYQSEQAGRIVAGNGTCRIREVFPETAQGVVVEGTLAMNERLSCAAGDVVWLRPVLGSGPVDLYVHLESNSSKVVGETRFRSIGRKIDGALLAELKSAAGVPLPRVQFQLIPLLSTPCDLYSLGVLAVQALLSDPVKFPLAVALDEVMSLGRRLAGEYDAGAGLGLRVRSVFESDPRWMTVLGPQRLAGDEVAAAQALDLIPGELWWDTLAMIVRMFPALGPDSVCANFGDAPQSAIHAVFGPTETELASLIHRTRSLIVIDWQLNREIRSVIRLQMAELSPS